MPEPQSTPGSAAPLTDTHLHVWDLSGGPYGVSYPWLTSGPLRRTHTWAEVQPQLCAAGVERVVLVQASDQLAETDELLRVAREARRPAAGHGGASPVSAEPVEVAVVGWLPLADAAAVEREIDRRPATELVGVRHLIHDEPDDRWMLRSDVAAGMAVLEAQGLAFDAVAERPDLLAQLPEVATRHPGLPIVLDHLGKPPITAGWGSEEAALWRAQIRQVAAHPQVAAKFSGLATITAEAQEWRPYLDHALESFGTGRLMLGSDWPVSTLAGEYADIMGAQVSLLAELSEREQRAIGHENAHRIYRLAPAA